MKYLAVIVAVLTVYVGYVDCACDHPPSLWCTSGEIAKQCGVGKHLFYLYIKESLIFFLILD